VAALAWGAFAFGAVYDWAYWPLLVVCAAIGAAGLRVRSAAPVPRAVALAMVLLAGAIGLQIIPLPNALFSRVSPAGDRLLQEHDVSYALQRTSAVDNRSRPSHALSIAPARTGLALALFAGFSIFLIGVTRLLERDGLSALMRGLAALGAILALVGIVSERLYTGRIYGFWTPVFDAVNPFGPFVNTNHFAGWMLMGLPLSLGYLGGLLSRRARLPFRDWRQQLLWLASPNANEVVMVAFACMSMALALVLTLSKSGLGGLLIALLIMAPFLTRWQQTLAQRLAVAGYLVLLVVVALGLTGLEAIGARFVESQSGDPWELPGRLDAWRFTLRIIDDFRWTGTGLNTFGVASILYDPNARAIHYAEAHNDYLQLVAEGGILLGLPLLLLCLALAREVRRRFREEALVDPMSRHLRIGAVAALIAIGFQELVDFSLQMPGNAALFCVVWAIALHHRPAPRPGSSRTTPDYS
jgi:O-antigen ligase